MKITLFKDKIFNRKLYSLALPIALQNLLLALVAVSDTVMLGALNQNAMSAVSLASQIQFVQNVTVSGVVAAFQVLGSQYAGKRDKRSVNLLLCMSLRVCFVISLLVSLLCFFTPRYLMLIFTNEESLITIGVSYLRLAAISYLITGISQCLTALIKLSSDTKSVAKISATAVVLNIILNAIFIFGLFGLPSMGIRGAALATVISRVVELLLAIRSSYRNEFTRPDLTKLFKYDKLLLKDFVKQLIPLTMAYLIWTLGFTSYTAFMGHMGLDAAAASAVSSSLRSLVLSFIRGLAGGSAILIGYELGKGELERAKIYGDRLFILSLIYGVLTSLVLLVITPIALNVVTLTALAKKYFIQMIIIQALYIVGCSFNSVVINGMFASGGDTMFDVYTLVVTMWLIAVPLAFCGTFFFNLSVALVYFCTCLDEIGKIPWTIHHYKKYLWLKDLTR